MFNFSKKTDPQIQHDVMNELKWDPRVTDAKISATANDGIVTLRGSVPHHFEKMIAEQAAQRVGGVRASICAVWAIAAFLSLSENWASSGPNTRIPT